MRTVYSFDDVLLTPKENSLESRSDVDTSTILGPLSLKIPIIASNMPTICQGYMAYTMDKIGGLGIVHRMQSIQDQVEQILFVTRNNDTTPGNVGAAVGIGEDSMERAVACWDAGANVLCVDVAHGHDFRVADLARVLLSEYGEIATIIAGNVATPEAADYICNYIVRAAPKAPLSSLILKAGIGGGSVCTTRVRTGCGIPTLQSILDISDSVDVMLIADGGIRTSGDIVKSLAAGASAVMLGNMLSGTTETPGDLIYNNGVLSKVYQGAASSFSKRAFYGKAEYVEGESTIVPIKGSVVDVIQYIMQGVRSGFSYCGSASLEDLWDNAEFVKMTNSGLLESHPHLLVGK